MTTKIHAAQSKPCELLAGSSLKRDQKLSNQGPGTRYQGPVMTPEHSTGALGAQWRIVHTYVRTYVRTYVHTYIRTNVHTYVCTYVRKHVHTYIHTYILTYVRTYIRTYVRTYVRTYLRTYAVSYTHLTLPTKRIV